jgi:hypothetical protein
MEGVGARYRLTNKMMYCFRPFVVMVLLSVAGCGSGDGNPICGNGMREGAEMCDLGTALNGQVTSSCSATCTPQNSTNNTGATTGQCCRSNTTGQFGYCTQICTGGVTGQGCSLDVTNQCLQQGGPGGGQQCCISQITQQSGYCAQVCTGGVVGNGCTADPSNACLMGAGTSGQCCHNQQTNQVGRCPTICPQGALCFIIPGICM